MIGGLAALRALMNQPDHPAVASPAAYNKLRIGAVSYLNTKPLVAGLPALLPEADLVFDYPSRLADALATAALDIALVPSIARAYHADWQIVSDACIGCRGPVLSVKLMFRVPPDRVRRLALDEASQTSAVLARILLAELVGVRPRLETLAWGSPPEENRADAVLVIGDRAIRDGGSEFVEVWDLGERWYRWTGRPFVFALWMARAGVATEAVAVALAQARDQGCRRLVQIAQEEAVGMQLPQPLVEKYLCHNLYYRLGPDQIEGLQLYYQQAARHGLIPQPPLVTGPDGPPPRGTAATH